MKKILSVLVLLLGLSAASMAQEANVATMMKSEKAGEYAFVLPGELSKEEVAKRSSYYTHYFDVSYNAKSSVATVTMKENTEQGRLVVQRFLMSTGVSAVKVGGKEVPVGNFAKEHLR